MIKVTVFYPDAEGTTFNMNYYCDKHMVIIKESMGSLLNNMSVDKGLAGLAPDSPAHYFAMCHMYFESLETFQKAFSSADNLMADIPNFTNTEPQVLLSDVML